MAESTDPATLKRGDQVPHFEVKRVDGSVFNYSTVWQHKNLLLIVLSGSSLDNRYVSDLPAHESKLEQHETECVVTREVVPRLRAPAALIADRWGEIIHLTMPSDAAELPSIEDLLGWLEYLQNRCPECEGEAK
jgi:hypothetical protein